MFLIVNIKKIQTIYKKYGFFKLIFSGGFVFYGGLIFAILFVFLFCKFFKLKFYNTISSLAIVAPLIHSIGRIGCLFSGCCYGILYNGLFSIKIRGNQRFPIQAVESFGNLLIFIILLFTLVKNKNHRTNFLLEYLTLYAILRFFCEFLRGDIQRGFIGIFSISQWFSIGILLFSFVFIAKWIVKSSK